MRIANHPLLAGGFTWALLGALTFFTGCGSDEGTGSQIGGGNGGTSGASGKGGGAGVAGNIGVGGSFGVGGSTTGVGGSSGVSGSGGSGAIGSGGTFSSGGSGGSFSTGGSGGTATGGTGGTGTGGTGGTPPVACTTNTNCDDGLWCTGVETCVNGFCVAGTPYACPNDGKSCTKETCVEATHTCQTVREDAACSDGAFCNGVERCDPNATGANATTGCVAGTAINCNDAYSCTQDSCDEVADACKNVATDSLCAGNTFCNPVICDPTTGAAVTGCRIAPPRTCDDNYSCTDDRCDEGTRSCINTPVQARCQDGSYCNGQETCAPGAGAAATGCRAGTAMFCPNDGQACTLERCDETKQSFNAQVACVTTYDSSKCASGYYCAVGGCLVAQACTSDADCTDGNACNGVETCDTGIGFCKFGPPKNCDDLIGCTADSCTPPGTCVNTPTNSLCNDNNVCNGSEICVADVGCSQGTFLDCDDNKSCTSDVCDPIAGCKHTPQDAACADGSSCNGSEVCDPASNQSNNQTGCRPGIALTCPADNIACTNDVCSDVAGGCTHTPDNSQCTCGQTCTTSGCANLCVQATCQGKLYQCGDCIDNDSDCEIDATDPQCLGPCQNNETNFFGDIPGQNNAPCKADCYFDQDTGSGNDDCYWSHECDPLEVSPNFYPEGNKCSYNAQASIPGTGNNCSQLYTTQSSTCLSICGPLTPNGCDCFGCCSIPGAPTTVWLGSVDASDNGTCDLDVRANPQLCKPCTQVLACANSCAHCELCVGKTELPADCTQQQCPSGVQLCGLVGQLPCPTGFYCVTGCCQRVPGG